MSQHWLIDWENARPYDALQEEAERQEQLRLDRQLQADLEAAALDVQRANAGYEAALQKVRCAPDGLVRVRRANLRLANARVLGAELRYAELRKQERP